MQQSSRSRLTLTTAGQSVYVIKPDAEGGSSLSVSVMEVGCDPTPKCVLLGCAGTPPQALTPTQ